MIIGISGKLGSGKDSFAAWFRYMTTPGREKNLQLAFDMLFHYGMAMIHQTGSPWQIKKFAAKLKQTATLLTGVPVEKWEDQEFKKQDMGSEWGMTYRQFLQRLGTEAMRDGLHTNTWVNALMSEHNETSLWLVTDVRFPNEANAIREKGGLMVRINRPCVVCGSTFNGHKMSCSVGFQEHSSESGLDKFDFDEIIVNDGTLVDLQSKVIEFINKHNLWQI